MAGCAGVDFNARKDSGLIYYPPKPYIFLSTGSDCTSVITLKTLPDTSNPKEVALKSGFGAAKLNLTLTDGMITTVGQETDTKIPETITALTGVLAATKAKTQGDGNSATTTSCVPQAYLIPIINGKVNLNDAIDFEVKPRNSGLVKE